MGIKAMVKTRAGWRWKPAKNPAQCYKRGCSTYRTGGSKFCRQHRDEHQKATHAKNEARKRRVRPASDAELARVQKRLEQLHGPAEGSETPPSA